MIRALSRTPSLFRASMVSFIAGIVVVSRADIASRSAPSLIACTNLSGFASTPRSTISNPAALSIIATRFLPMSCRSPRTVPIATVPFGS